jgi:hypothetical protein
MFAEIPSVRSTTFITILYLINSIILAESRRLPNPYPNNK